MEEYLAKKKAEYMKEFDEIKTSPRISIAQYDEWIDECVKKDDELKARLKSKADWIRPNPKTIEIMLEMAKCNYEEEALWQENAPGMLREMLREQGYKVKVVDVNGDT